MNERLQHLLLQAYDCCLDNEWVIFMCSEEEQEELFKLVEEYRGFRFKDNQNI